MRQQPKVEIKNDEETYTHPAFGFMRVTRPSGGDGTLFMSNVEHRGCISITIGEAEMTRQHYHDKHRARRELVTVEMSSVQFADLMAGLGNYSGVPCTIRRIEGVGMLPRIDMSNTVNRFSKEMQEKFGETGKDLADLAKSVRAALDAAKVSKTKQAEILQPIEVLAREIGANMPFMEKMFRESVEGIVQEAKAVVEAYATEQGLAADAAPLQLTRSE